MRGADHVVVNTATNAFECRHCGARYTPALPCSLTMYLGMSRTFIREHRRCLPRRLVASLADLTPATEPMDPALPMFLRQQAD